jgi:hypothetical protein
MASSAKSNPKTPNLALRCFHPSHHLPLEHLYCHIEYGYVQTAKCPSSPDNVHAGEIRGYIGYPRRQHNLSCRLHGAVRVRCNEPCAIVDIIDRCDFADGVLDRGVRKQIVSCVCSNFRRWCPDQQDYILRVQRRIISVLLTMERGRFSGDEPLENQLPTPCDGACRETWPSVIRRGPLR